MLPACLPDGSSVKREFQALFCEKPEVQSLRLTLPDENDLVIGARISVFTQALADLGWTDGRNVRMDIRWGGADANRIRTLAQELVGLQPDIILTNAAPPTSAVQRETRTIPIVFVNVGDPVASGIVARLGPDNSSSVDILRRL